MKLPIRHAPSEGHISCSTTLERQDRCINRVAIFNPCNNLGRPVQAGDKTLKTETFGLWDTGCTKTSVDASIAEKLKLRAVSKNEVHTAGGKFLKPLYLVSLVIEELWWWTWLPVYEANLISSDEAPKILIGMDIIKHGEFAISHGKFSWCYPPCGNPVDLHEKAKKVNDKINRKRRK